MRMRHLSGNISHVDSNDGTMHVLTMNDKAYAALNAIVEGGAGAQQAGGEAQGTQFASDDVYDLCRALDVDPIWTDPSSVPEDLSPQSETA